MSNQDAVLKPVSRRGFLGNSLLAACVGGLRADGPSIPDPAVATPNTRIKEYRTLGRTGVKVSDISFGTGNLTNANVLAVALDRGINYIDTGEHYTNGNAERAVGEAIKGRDRKKIFITTKLNLWHAPTSDKQGIKDRFRKCLERLQTDHADCLMIHMCTLAQVKHEPYHEAIRELKAEGRVRFSGLSNHGADLSLYGRLDDPMDAVLLAATEDGRFDVALFVYNYLKTDPGEKIIAACQVKGMGITLMKMDPAFYINEDKNIIAERLARYKTEGKEVPPSFHDLVRLSEERAEKARAFLNKHDLSGPEQTRGAAIKFCLNHPAVACVCPSINSFEEMEAFLPLSGQPMRPRDKAMLHDLSGWGGNLYCRHACGICEPSCPHGVPVNTIMRYDYYFRAKRMEKHALRAYAALGPHDASRCAACAGNCGQACPHGVPIQGKLILAHDTLAPV